MKIDPKKAILTMTIPCEKCDGDGYDRVVLDDNKKEIGRLPCQACKGSGCQDHHMTLEELLSGLKIKPPAPPISIGPECLRPDAIVWRQP